MLGAITLESERAARAVDPRAGQSVLVRRRDVGTQTLADMEDAAWLDAHSSELGDGGREMRRIRLVRANALGRDNEVELESHVLAGRHE